LDEIFGVKLKDYLNIWRRDLSSHWMIFTPQIMMFVSLFIQLQTEWKTRRSNQPLSHFVLRNEPKLEFIISHINKTNSYTQYSVFVIIIILLLSRVIFIIHSPLCITLMRLIRLLGNGSKQWMNRFISPHYSTSIPQVNVYPLELSIHVSHTISDWIIIQKYNVGYSALSHSLYSIVVVATETLAVIFISTFAISD